MSINLNLVAMIYVLLGGQLLFKHILESRAIAAIVSSVLINLEVFCMFYLLNSVVL